VLPCAHVRVAPSVGPALVATIGTVCATPERKCLQPSFRIHREIERCHSDTRSLYIALYGVTEWGGGGACL
jgi:hypothetical protein